MFSKELTNVAAKIAPLTSNNWFKWKFEMDMLLGVGGLDDVVYGREQIPKDVEVTLCHMINDIMCLMLLVLPFRIIYGCLHN